MVDFSARSGNAIGCREALSSVQTHTESLEGRRSDKNPREPLLASERASQSVSERALHSLKTALDCRLEHTLLRSLDCLPAFHLVQLVPTVTCSLSAPGDPYVRQVVTSCSLLLCESNSEFESEHRLADRVT